MPAKPGESGNCSLKIGYLTLEERPPPGLHRSIEHVIVLINSNAPHSIDQDIMAGAISSRSFDS